MITWFHDSKTNFSIIHLKDAAQLFDKALLIFSFLKERNDCKSTQDDSSPHSWWWKGDGWGCDGSGKIFLKDGEYFFT